MARRILAEYVCKQCSLLTPRSYPGNWHVDNHYQSNPLRHVVMPEVITRQRIE